MTMKTCVLVLLVALGCGDATSGDAQTTTSDTGGDSFTVCESCPIGGSTCPAGQVCAAVSPAGGGVCMLACSANDPDPCTYKGIVTGACKEFYPDKILACNDPDNGPVCPPT